MPAGVGGLVPRDVPGQLYPRVSARPVRSSGVVSPEHRAGSDGVADAHPGVGPRAPTAWLPADLGSAAPRRVARQSQACPPSLPPRGAPSADAGPSPQAPSLAPRPSARARGAPPRSITVDHGTEFQLRALEDWTFRSGVQLDFIRPGKRTGNAHIESFNGRLRDERLNVHQFLSLADTQAKIEAWRCDFTDIRPHGSLGHLTSLEHALRRQAA